MTKCLKSASDFTVWEGRSETWARINYDAEASRDETRAAKRAVQADAEVDQEVEQDKAIAIDDIALPFQACLRLSESD